MQARLLKKKMDNSSNNNSNTSENLRLKSQFLSLLRANKEDQSEIAHKSDLIDKFRILDIRIDSGMDTILAVESLRKGTKQLKRVNDKVDIDEIAQIVEEQAEELQIHSDNNELIFQDLMGQNQDIDSDEEKELLALLGDMEDMSLITNTTTTTNANTNANANVNINEVLPKAPVSDNVIQKFQIPLSESL